ncbi:unnamed protein product [Cuscuta epithymum]|uniref:PAR1 protein n=1 Tax=Cuscuta epithymum TaxID=186058 RepID=A0AAV0GHR6_9ASTE|nr:unnamed protein product [Cuscuta epithymum]
MASSIKLSLIVFFACSLFLQGTLGEIICEELPKENCAFSIASSGKRCLLESSPNGEGGVEFQCKTSEVVVGMMAEYIETDDCVAKCGVDRNSVGLSSDSLMETEFTKKLCSSECHQNCPNIVDLYFNMAAGEGVYLPELCENLKSSHHRAMTELLSSGAVDTVANGPAADGPNGYSNAAFDAAAAPADSPTSI